MVCGGGQPRQIGRGPARWREHGAAVPPLFHTLSATLEPLQVLGQERTLIGLSGAASPTIATCTRRPPQIVHGAAPLGAQRLQPATRVGVPDPLLFIGERLKRSVGQQIVHRRPA